MNSDQLGGVLAVFSDPVLVVDRAQRITIANPKAEDAFEAGLVGRHILSIIRHPEIVDAVQQVLDGTPEVTAKFVQRKSGEAVFHTRISALSRSQTGIDGALILFRDVTTIETAEAARREFVANVSHELRSPLTALSGFIETLQGAAAEDAAARARFLAIMQTEANRMGRLIDDLLSLSRVEANERLRPKSQVDVVAVLNAVTAGLVPGVIDDPNLVAINTKQGAQVLPGDSDQLRQVFQNLIENALKYSGGKQVNVTITPLDRFVGIAGPVVRVDIRDLGPGIASHHLPRLTERFYRVDDHRSRHLGGTGLGLAIVKHIINRHRGRMVIESVLGQGSNFSVILPVT